MNDEKMDNAKAGRQPVGDKRFADKRRKNVKRLAAIEIAARPR